MSRITLHALLNDRDPGHAGRAEMTGDRFTIGRGPDNDWVLEDPRRVVSKRHAVIERRGGGVRLSDRSTNGIRVNGRALSRGEAHDLADGDEIELGGYRFRAEVGSLGAAAAQGRSAPAITSILHDLAPTGGSAAESTVEGERRHVEEAYPLTGGGTGGRAVAGPLGWDSPPDTLAPEIARSPEAWSGSRELTDRSEQAGPDQRIIDLPVVARDAGAGPAPSVPAPPALEQASPAAASPVLPPDWMDEDDSDAPTPAPTPTPPVDVPVPSPEAVLPRASSLNVLPVTNLNVDETPPEVPSVPAQDEGEVARDLVGALAEAMGVPCPELGEREARRLLRNAGHALAIAAGAARDLQAERVRTLRRLDVRTAERTPWVNAVGARDGTDVPAAVFRTLAECEPHELEGLRADFDTARAALDAVATAAEETAGIADRALDHGTLRKRMAFLDRFRSGGRAGALLRVLRREGRIMDGKGRPRVRALLADELSRKLGGSDA